MQDWEGNSAYAKYETFGLTGPEGQYRITVDNYSGNAGIAGAILCVDLN